MDATSHLAGLHLFTNCQRINSCVVHFCATGAFASFVYSCRGNGRQVRPAQLADIRTIHTDGGVRVAGNPDVS